MGVVEATYAEIKQQELKKNPYSCLSTAAIDVNPHQVEAFIFSLAAMKLGGAILADEVGLGKTIESGLVLKYLLNSGSQKILLVMPSNLSIWLKLRRPTRSTMKMYRKRHEQA